MRPFYAINHLLDSSNENELADKPGSVVDNHSSRNRITPILKRPTRVQRGSRLMYSYLVLLQVGFTSATKSRLSYGALLPHLLTLTETLRSLGGLISSALSISSRLLDVI